LKIFIRHNNSSINKTGKKTNVTVLPLTYRMHLRICRRTTNTLMMMMMMMMMMIMIDSEPANVSK